MLGFDGAVAIVPLELNGICVEARTRTLIGGPSACPEDFVQPPNTVAPDTLRLPRLKEPFGRTPSWAASTHLEQAQINVLRSLKAQKTYAAQQANVPSLDAIDRNDTEFRLSAEVLKTKATHRQGYDDYLQVARRERDTLRQARRFGTAAQEAFDTGHDLGLDGGSGLAQPFPEMPAERGPLYLERPEVLDEGTKADGGGAKLALFDAYRLYPRKFKPKPTAPEEIRECKQPLSPKDLLLVTGGPKTIDFGSSSVFTTVSRNFTILNELRASILVVIEASEEDELKTSTPLSQVVPGGASAGFDLNFCSAEPCSFRRTVSYVINGMHTFKLTAVAEVGPTEVNISKEELHFSFDASSLDFSMRETLTLSNPGTAPAKFAWGDPAEFKGKPAFRVEPADGEVPPKKSVQVAVVFTPFLGAHTEHALTMVVKGGASKTIVCKAEMREARTVCTEKKIDFGLMPVGVAAEKVLVLKNPPSQASTDAVFAFDKPPARLGVKPARGLIPVGARWRWFSS